MLFASTGRGTLKGIPMYNHVTFPTVLSAGSGNQKSRKPLFIRIPGCCSVTGDVRIEGKLDNSHIPKNPVFLQSQASADMGKVDLTASL